MYKIKCYTYCLIPNEICNTFMLISPRIFFMSLTCLVIIYSPNIFTDTSLSPLFPSFFLFFSFFFSFFESQHRKCIPNNIQTYAYTQTNPVLSVKCIAIDFLRKTYVPIVSIIYAIQFHLSASSGATGNFVNSMHFCLTLSSVNVR